MTEVVMVKRFQHQVCYSVNDRVTFVNGVWQGPNKPESERQQEDIAACPLVWDFLQLAGGNGWELVCVLETWPRDAPKHGPQFVRTLYLKREQS